jgi:CubicO group peptidase (beta-lactamase class C family)
MTGLPSAAKAVLVLCASAMAIASAAPAATDKTAGLDAIFAHWNGKSSPGCAVAVSLNGAPIAMRAYGMADLEHGIPATPDSIYEAGSDSKQFVAAAMVMLARDGKISLDDDVHKYLPELPDYGAKLTLRDMLHHISGLRDWGSVAAVEGWPRNSRTADNQDVLDITARQKELNFAPGTHYLYSNTNFNLAAIIVSRVSGQSLADFTRDRIFVPLGMTHTTWRDDHSRVVPGRTGAYEASPTGYRNDQVIEDAYGNGGLLTTVGDLVKWQAALDASTFGPGFTDEMQRPGMLRNGTKIAYALALVNLDHHGEREVSHSGSTGGYRAWMARYPDRKLAVSLLCNAGDADTPTLGRQVADLYLPAHPAKPFVPTTPLPAGTWADRLTGYPVRFESDAQGRLRANGRVVTPVGPGRWVLREDVFAFSGQTLVRETREGENLPADKVDAVTDLDPAPYLGRYCGVDTQACVTVTADGKALRFSGPRWHDHALKAAYRDVFVGDGAPQSSELVLKFKRDAAGRIDGIRLGESRAFDLLFHRTN